MNRDSNEQVEHLFVDTGNIFEEQQAEWSTDNYFAIPPDKNKTAFKDTK